jgi:4a-hydroxytetrahydrobiopterin dehydratase
MSRANVTVLPPQDYPQILHDLPTWQMDHGALQRDVKAPTYLQALDLLHEIGMLAEKANHHPDLRLNYTHLVIRFCTHEPPGITNLDVEMAHKVDTLLRERLKD